MGLDALDADPPSLQEICALTRHSLTHPSPFKDLTILGAGRAALDLLPRDPETCMLLAYSQLHAVPYNEVKACWRRLYTDAVLWQVLLIGEEKESVGCGGSGRVEGSKTGEATEDKWIGKVVKLLDMALILTGAPEREELVELWFEALEARAHTMSHSASKELGVPPRNDGEGHVENTERPSKRRRVDVDICPSFPETFPDTITIPPSLRRPLPRARELGLSAFQSHISSPDTQTPLIIEGAIDHWPALEDERAWKKPAYLLRKTLGGQRLVPVEIGRSYTDEGWGQKILSFADFMQSYMLDDPHGRPTNGKADPNGDSDTEAAQKGYLAQHNLFSQIPSLRSDIAIPDYCYCEPAPTRTNPANVKPVEKLEEPLLNAWFGPKDTISPLHTDPYHNILAQVVGYKYVRLYAPEETPKLYPRDADENGIDMSNTSRVDLGMAMGAWPEISCWETSTAGHRSAIAHVDDDERVALEHAFTNFKHAAYLEGVLGPGDCVYIPTGWWHYVRSLTPSFSVSFWWN
ncbi:hypothetical protein N0V90_007511 [Kalmusia sp. IMI 367209]|nr:hypothetical protein N0V90_007511 [Kalmusia sp. IMI 367209]